MMKTALMNKLMMNLMKMNLMETRMFKLMDMYHPSKFSTKFWRTSKGYMSLPMQHLVMYRITQDKSSPVHYHLPSTPQFEHVENLSNVISSSWTPWVQHTIGYLSGEFVVGQVFNSKSDLQEAAKIYSIKGHQEFVVVASSKKLLVLRCKKAEECQCLWKLRSMVVKDTCFLVINKYQGPYTFVNPCLNRDHHQLDSNLVAAHIKAIIKA